MTPLVTAPARGYTDYQRLENWDSGVVWVLPCALGNATIFSPILDCSRFAYVGGHVYDANNQHIETYSWYSDKDATVTLGQRSFVVNSNVTTAAQLRLPNLGPFLQVRLAAIAAGLFQPCGALVFTNRPHPLEFVPSSPVLISRQVAALGAGATDTLYPSDYYAGPVSVWVQPSNAAFQFALKGADPAGTDVFFDFRPLPVGNSTFNLVTPPGLWYVQVTNGGAAGSYYLSVRHPTTGST